MVPYARQESTKSVLNSANIKVADAVQEIVERRWWTMILFALVWLVQKT